MSFLIEFLEFLKVRKKYWLIPILLTLALFGSIIVLTFINCEKPEDYCETIYKEYYYDFQTKQAKTLSIKECYYY